MAIVVTALGTAQDKASTSPWNAPTGLSLATSDRVIIGLASDLGASVVKAIYEGVKQEYSETGDTNPTFYGASWLAQTFLTGSAYNIVGVQLMLGKGGVPPGNINIEIRAVDADGKPTGGALASGSIAASSVTDIGGYASWLNIPLSSYTLSNATSYAIVLSLPDGNSSNNIYIKVDTANPYANGQRVNSSDSGVSWSLVSTDDFQFRTLSVLGETILLNSDASASNAGNVILAILSGKVSITATTWYIQVTNTSTAKAIAVYKVSGLADTPLDKTKTAVNAGTTPSSTDTLTTAQADELLIGGIGTEGPDGDLAGTWNGDTTDNNQRLGTTGGGAAGNITVAAATKIVAATGTYSADKTGIDSRDWAAAIATYKAAAAAYQPYRMYYPHILAH